MSPPLKQHQTSAAKRAGGARGYDLYHVKGVRIAVRMRIWTWTLLSLCCAGLARGQSAPATPANPVAMRYQFRVGERWVYQRSIEERPLDAAHGGQPRRGREQLQLWVLAQRGDRTRVLIDLIRLDGSRISESLGGPVDVADSGARTWPDEMQPRCVPLLDALDVLPIVLHDYERGPSWTTAADELGRQMKYEISPPAVGESLQRVRFERIDPTGASQVSGATASGTFWFDLDTRRVTRVESESVDAARGVRVLVRSELFTIKQQEAEWCARRGEDCDRLMRAMRSEDRLVRTVCGNAAAARTWSDFSRIWNESVSELSIDTESPLPRLAGGWKTRIESRLPELRRWAALVGRWQDQAAPQWSLQDAGGGTVRSETLRDRPNLELFWNNSSGDSLHMLEVVRRLRLSFPEAGLRIVCIQTDNDFAAARAAAAQAGVGLMHVFGGGPLLGDATGSVPIARLIDKNGRVEGVWFGWEPRLERLVRERL